MTRNSAYVRKLPNNFLSSASPTMKVTLWFGVMLVVLALQGCTNISSVVNGITPISAPISDPGGGMVDGRLNTPMSFQVSGTGVCSRMFINFGDGTQPLEIKNVDLASKPTFTYTYTGWNGPKTVWAYGNLSDGCGGDVKIPIYVGPRVFRLTYLQPAAAACMSIPGKPALRKNTLVTIINFNRNNTAADDASVIDFGCFGGCYNKAGGLNSVAQPGLGYPAPGFRERSLVIQVGSQQIQGGVDWDTTFTTTESAPLEFCVNDFKIDDNKGGWGIGITIDESAAQ